MLVAIPARGQIVPDSVGPWVHESWTVREGLPVNGVISILQSRDGYLWASTLDGLVRYDGARFTVFNSSHSAAIPTNRFTAGLEAPDGSLWFRTEDYRLIRYQRGSFTHFDRTKGAPAIVSLIDLDSTGRMWIGSTIFGVRGGDVGLIRDDRYEFLARDTVPATSVVHRRDGTTWIGTAEGRLYRVVGGATLEMIGARAIDSSAIGSLVEDDSGTLWIGTERGVWAEHRGALRPFQTSNRKTLHVFQLVYSPARRTVYAYTSGGVYRVDRDRLTPLHEREITQVPAPPITIDAIGAVWFGAGPEIRRDGRLIYTLPTKAGWTVPPDITSLLIDREGGIWLATTQGLDRIKPAIFRTFSVGEGLGGRNVYPVYADRSGRIWAGSWYAGLNRIDPDGRVTSFSGAPATPTIVHTIVMDRQDRLWTIGNSPLAMCEQPALRCALAKSGYIAGDTYALYFDKAERLWAGTLDGIFLREANTWRKMTEWTATRPARVFLETSDGAMWIGTNGDGVARWEADHFDYLKTADGLPSELIRSLYQDRDGLLWIGTEGRGLAVLDPGAWKSGSGQSDRRIRRIGASEGLYDETIHQILEDDAGRFWMNTNRGIFWVTRLELRDFIAGRITRVHSTSYTERDGLRNREGNGGFQPAGSKSRDGRLWFPTQNGVVMVDPARLTPAALPPAVVEAVVAGDSTLVAAAGSLSLGVSQRNLQIEYTASSFVEPNNVRFRYQLENYDPSWIDVGNRRTAFYTRVPPGRYRFRVQAGSSAGEWNEAGEASVELDLAAQFWETAGFRAALLVSLVLSTLLAVRLRIAQLRQKARELELVVADRTRQLSTQNEQLGRQATQLAELDRAKSRFFANVSHEFRTPLTLTIGPLENLRSRSGSDSDSARWLDLALRNSRRLLRLVNQILDVAKLEAGHMKLERRRFDLVPFVRGVSAVFETVARQRRITLGVTAPESLIGAFDSDALEKILTNLLSNALKFAPPDGSVTVTLAGDSDAIVLRVADDGPGIPEDQLSRVFERFYQSSESAHRREPGTGIGLSLVKELVELHRGSIEVASGSGVPGTTFTVRLPRLDESDVVMLPAASTVTVPAAKPDRTDGTDTGDDASDDDTPTLLIVDDSLDLRVWIREHFSTRFRIYEAADGAEGIALAQAHLPDMVISDVMMPGIDGMELCRTLRANPETDFLPIILLTARAGSETRIEGLERGADDYVTKPFEMRELEARVDNLIALRRRLRERFAQGATVAAPPMLPVESQTPLDPADQALADRIRAAIEAHLADPDFGVEELAKAVFQDRTHLFRRTKQLFGVSPSDLLRRARIERGARLLTEGAGTVTDVAYAVGFNKVSHFCRVFHATYGATPAAWRARSAELRDPQHPGHRLAT